MSELNKHLNKHLKAFVFSIELLQEMITAGWEIGTTDIVRCVRGLPANARFEYIEPSADSTVIFVFSHPTWPAVTSADDVPREAIALQRIERYDNVSQ